MNEYKRNYSFLGKNIMKILRTQNKFLDRFETLFLLPLIRI